MLSTTRCRLSRRRVPHGGRLEVLANAVQLAHIDAMSSAAASRIGPMGSWVVLGALAGVALANIGSRWFMLLVPVAVAGAVLIWQLNPKQEFFGSIAGFAVLPVIVGTRPVPCALDGCDTTTQIVWPFLAVALALVVVGVLVGTRPASSLEADESHQPSLPRRD